MECTKVAYPDGFSMQDHFMSPHIPGVIAASNAWVEEMYQQEVKENGPNHDVDGQEDGPGND